MRGRMPFGAAEAGLEWWSQEFDAAQTELDRNGTQCTMATAGLQARPCSKFSSSRLFLLQSKLGSQCERTHCRSRIKKFA